MLQVKPIFRKILQKDRVMPGLISPSHRSQSTVVGSAGFHYLTLVFQILSISQEEMMSEGGDHESWDDEMMMNENNETPLPMVRNNLFPLYFHLRSLRLNALR